MVGYSAPLHPSLAGVGSLLPHARPDAGVTEGFATVHVDSGRFSCLCCATRSEPFPAFPPCHASYHHTTLPCFGPY